MQNLKTVLTICLIATSRDFLEIVLPSPVLSVAAFTGFLVDNSETCEALRESEISLSCPPPSTRPLPEGSVSLPLLTMGDDCLRGFATLGLSAFALVVTEGFGLDLPADRGLSGRVVRRFGGVSSEKSGGTIGCDGRRTWGLGELGRETEAAGRPLVTERPAGVDDLEAGDNEGVMFRRVGVEGLEVDRAAGVLKFAGIWAREVGVEGLELWVGLEGVLGAWRTLEGVEGLDTVAREVGVEGLAEEDERLVGVDGLI